LTTEGLQAGGLRGELKGWAERHVVERGEH
jgi:hypothetical protein